MEVAVLLLGLAIGAIAGWFLRAGRTGPDLAVAKQRAEQAEGQLLHVTKQKDAAIEQLREESSRRATFEAVASGVTDLQREIEARSMSIAQQQRTILDVTTEKESLAATLDA